MKDLLNWGELSRRLVGNRSSITRKRIPKKHKAFIAGLLKVIEDYLNQKS